MLTRKMFSSANLCEYEVKQTQISLFISPLFVAMNLTAHSTDSNNYERNTFIYQNFSHISEKYIKLS